MGIIFPILYDSAETAFTSNGLGRLSSCISCTVTEERNGIFECVFTYPVTGVHYDEIEEGMIVAVIHDDSKTVQPFDIYKRSAPIEGIVTFNAHHISYRQSLIVVNPFTASSCAQAMAKLKTEAVTTNPFNYVTDKQTAADFKLIHPSGIRQILGGVEGSILDVFGGGEFLFDKFTTYLYQNRGTDTDVQIRYGKNLTSIEKEYDISGIYNAAVPYWLNQQDNTIIMLPERIIYASGQTGYVRAVAMDLSGEFEEEPTEAQLRQTAAAKLANSKAWLPEENIKVDFVALWQTPEYESIAPLQRVRLCDTVSVYFPELGVVANRQKVIKTVYNVLLERYDSIELGEAKTSLAKMITDRAVGETRQAVTQAVGFFQRALDEATQLITGGLGGYVVFNLNADGKPQEILVMDTDDITTAVNVIRLNKNGIGFSQNGYNGPFSSSWTIDNTLNMAQINVVNLTANLVRTGLLTDELGNNYWNLTTGEFRLAATTTVGGSTVQSIANNAASAAESNAKSYADGVAASEAAAAVAAQTQLSIFNKLTNNGQTQGIYLQNGKLYINADYMQSGNISADRIRGGNFFVGNFGGMTSNIYISPSGDPPTAYRGLINDDGIELRGGRYYLKDTVASDVLLGRYLESSVYRYGIKITNSNGSNSPEWRIGVQQNPSTGAHGFFEHRGVKTNTSNISQGRHPEGCVEYYCYTSSSGNSPAYHVNFAYHDGISIAVGSGTGTGTDVYLLQILKNGIFFMQSGSNDLVINYTDDIYSIKQKNIAFDSSSSKRYKKDISAFLDDRNDPRRLYRLKVKQFTYKDGVPLQYKDMAGQKLPGFIAEEVAEIYPAAVIRDNDGRVESWDERRILPGVLALVQDQRKEIDELKAETDNLKKQMELITKQIKEMRTGA